MLGTGEASSLPVTGTTGAPTGSEAPALMEVGVATAAPLSAADDAGRPQAGKVMTRNMQATRMRTRLMRLPGLRSPGQRR